MSYPNPPKINLLSEHLIDQIKAGEVIERPGNLVKEILENSLDAGSTFIELFIQNNGLDLISLSDNGHGMVHDDLPYAFARHATSKIKDFEDLYKLVSFGFRGEALASICAVSKLQCITKAAGHTKASEIRIHGGETVLYEQRETFSKDHGTDLQIQSLFYNTPARLKFIQSQQSEKTFLKKIIYSFITSHPEVEFHLKFNDEEKVIFSKKSSLIDRIRDIIPKAKNEISTNLRSYEDYQIEIFLIPSTYKGPFKIQFQFINERMIVDKQIVKIISNALQNYHGHDDYHYLAFLTLPPESIDVNIHPSKTLIKIFESSKLMSLITSTIKELSPKSKPLTPNSQNNGYSQIPLSPTEPLELDFNQEKYHYNLEGQFSPHRLASGNLHHLIWTGPYIILLLDGDYYGVSSAKLLNYFIASKLKNAHPSIPLLVSEPFRGRHYSSQTKEELTLAGFEFDSLGQDLIVLRSIPDWLNGFPVKEITEYLLEKKNILHFPINSQDWSSLTWQSMINNFTINELIENKIMINVQSALRDKI